MKKQLLCLALATACNVPAYAWNTYVGMELDVRDITASSSAYRGLYPGLFIGYGTALEPDYYFSVELSASLAATLNNYYINRVDSMRLTPIYTLSVIPGMMLSSYSMAYLRVGASEASVSAASTWRPGALIGIGLESALSPCWSVRAEYDYTIFSAAGVGTPRSDEFALSAKYTFDV